MAKTIKEQVSALFSAAATDTLKTASGEENPIAGKWEKVDGFSTAGKKTTTGYVTPTAITMCAAKRTAGQSAKQGIIVALGVSVVPGENGQSFEIFIGDSEVEGTPAWVHIERISSTSYTFKIGWLGGQVGEKTGIALAATDQIALVWQPNGKVSAWRKHSGTVEELASGSVPTYSEWEKEVLKTEARSAIAFYPGTHSSVTFRASEFSQTTLESEKTAWERTVSDAFLISDSQVIEKSVDPYKPTVLSTPGLVGFWPLNDTSGSTAIDLMGVKNGVYQNAPLLAQPSLLPSGEGKSVKLDGSSQYISVADAEALRLADTLSIEGWMKPEAFGGDMVCAAHNGSAEVRAETTFTLNKKEVALIVNAKSELTSGTAVHFVMTKSGSSVHLYINGVDVTGSVTNSTLEATLSGWIFGKNGTRPENYFKGYLQFLALYNVALEPAVALGHYESGFVTHEHNVEESDSVAASDSVAFKHLDHQQILDSLGLTENFVVSKGRGRSVADAATTSDSLKRILGKGLSDKVSLSDTIVLKDVSKHQLLESVAVKDEVTVEKYHPEGVPRFIVRTSFPVVKVALKVVTPSGQKARWAEDEPKAVNVLSEIESTTEMPGGYKDLQGVLGRDPTLDWADLIAYGDATLYIPGCAPIWQGFLDKTPDISGDQMSITPAFLGYQAILEDNQAAQIGFINADLSEWEDPSIERRKRLLENNIQLVANVVLGLSTLDPTGTAPGVFIDFSNVEAPAATWSQAGESDFYGGGIDIGEVRFDYRQITPYAAEEIWESDMVLGTTDSFITNQIGEDYNRSTHLEQRLIANGPGWKWARCRDLRAPSGAAISMTDITAWQNIRVLGRTFLEPKGTWPNIGFSAKQMLEYLIPRLASPLTVDTNYLDDDGYVIPHAWYGERGAVADIVKDIVKYALYDWFVYHDKRFEYREPGTYGKYWKASVAPSQLNETGQDSQRLWRSIVVRYQDPSGRTLFAGPPGSGCETESELLEVSDPDHPAVLAHRTRQDILDLSGIGSPTIAIGAGKIFLEEAALINRSGSATLAGYVMDQFGIFWPAACVKSGDYISFVDSSDKGYRKIINTSYKHTEKSVEIDLDAPASGLEALLERLQAGLISLGVS